MNNYFKSKSKLTKALALVGFCTFAIGLVIFVPTRYDLPLFGINEWDTRISLGLSLILVVVALVFIIVCEFRYNKEFGKKERTEKEILKQFLFTLLVSGLMFFFLMILPDIINPPLGAQI
jgi:formate hydrogenlyase subunit 3/multisubunit Na+/H+ antiporter MnhD subunit